MTKITLLALVFVLGAWPDSAGAATFSKDWVYQVGGYVLRFTADAGESNQLTLTSSATVTTASDPGAGVTAGTACTQVDTHTVTCPRRDPNVPLPEAPIVEVDVALGDGNDSAVATADCEYVAFGARCRHIDGGTGNDQLTGGGDGDAFIGRDADGNDTYTGGGGSDVADYSAATTAVDVALDAVADDGPSGQQDLVPPGMAVVGGSAGDTLVGSQGADDLDGGPGADTLTGNGGDDHLRAGIGIGDTLLGGPGDDVLDGQSSQVAAALGGDDNDVITATAVDTATVDGGAGDDVMTGAGPIHGGDGNDVLHAAGGGTLDGGPGDDVLDDHESWGIAQEFNGGSGFDTVKWTGPRNEGINASNDGVANDGGPPACQACGPEGDNVGTDVERLVGTSWPDTLTGGSGDDVLQGRQGADQLVGGGGSDVVEYSEFTTPVSVTLGAQTSGPDGDTIGADIEGATGGSADDVLIGGPGDGRFSGGSGADQLRGGPGADVLSGGPGNDSVGYEDHANGVDVTIDDVADDGNGTDAGAGGVQDDVRSDVERLAGSPGEDVLTGGVANEHLAGGAGNDVLAGQGGNDVLVGGPGDDDLNGGSGTDLADYSAESQGVLVTLDSVPDDGNQNEFDLVLPDVENVLGGAGDDLLVGSAAGNHLEGSGGDDLLSGGPGADALDGGTGQDVVSYFERSTSVSVTLNAGANDDGGVEDGSPGARDDVKDIESVIGGSGADSLVGTYVDNAFDGGPGADVITGDLGFDSVDYGSRTEGVTVDLSDTAPSAGGTLDGPPGSRDQLIDIEDAFGGAGPDSLHGSAAGNFLFGRQGDDLLDLRDPGGEDAAFCDEGTDIAYGDPGDFLDDTCEQRNPAPPSGGNAPPVEQPAPSLSMQLPRRLTLDRRGRLTLSLRSDRDALAQIVATFRIRGVKRSIRVRALHVRLRAGKKVTVRLRLRTRDLRKIRAALRRRRTVTVRIDATIPGTVTHLRRTATLRR